MVIFVQAEDGIRVLVRSRGLGEVYKRQQEGRAQEERSESMKAVVNCVAYRNGERVGDCLLYTSDAADDLLCVDLGGRRFHTPNNTTAAHSINVFSHTFITRTIM